MVFNFGAPRFAFPPLARPVYCIVDGIGSNIGRWLQPAA